MQKSLDYDYVFKYILIGDASVGKSTILNHFINGNFKGDSNPTMGVEFATRKLNVGDKVIKIQIWDTVDALLFRPDRSLLGLLPGRTIGTLSASFWFTILITTSPLRQSTRG
jgi:GTPase SAR1 family protein